LGEKMSAPRIVIVDVGSAVDSAQLHDLLAAGFAFPGCYGRDWDAFWDCVTTLDPMPEKIIVRGLEVLTRRLPRDGKLLADCLRDFRAASDLAHVQLSIE
jgi:ribonuclease inhibitor